MKQEWTDLFAMLDDLHAHVRETRREVELADDPKTRKVGWMDSETGRIWRISLIHVRNAFASSEDRRVKGFRSLIGTVAGRRKLGNLPLWA